MTNSTYTAGADALSALTATNDGGSSKKKEFTKLRNGKKITVRVMSTSDLISFYNYGNYDRGIYSFVAKEPSTLNGAGFPTKETMTPWDKAAQYYQDLANAEMDKAKKEKLKAEARIYRGSVRFALAFIDLDTGEPIYIDLSKKQALAVHTVFKSVADKGKLDKKAFEITKTGEGTSTTAVATQLDLDDLTDKQSQNYAKASEFAGFDFNGLLYEADKGEQLANLVKAGFDLSLIGEAPTNAPDTPDTPTNEQESEEPFPF